MSREARVGIFVLLGLIVLTFFTFRVSKWGLIAEKGYRLTVDFDTASGLEPKSDVKMAGVPIGKVEEIELVGNRARLVLRIHKGIRIPIDSVGSIQTQGLLGEKYVEILPGKDAQRNLPAGGQVANTLSPVNLDEMIRKLSAIGDDVKKFTESLSSTFGTEEGKKALGDILRDVQATTAVLRTVVTGNEQRFERIVANIDRLSADLSDISSANKQDVRATIANLRAFLRHAEERDAGAGAQARGDEHGGERRRRGQPREPEGEHREPQDRLRAPRQHAGRRREGDGQDRPRRGDPRDARQRQHGPQLPHRHPRGDQPVRPEVRSS